MSQEPWITDHAYWGSDSGEYCNFVGADNSPCMMTREDHTS